MSGPENQLATCKNFWKHNMHWAKTFISTLRDDPQEAEIPSHKLMLRAGLIRRLGGGLYTYLPLGLKALRKVEAIVREEMNAAGAIEVLMPAMQPREIWETSGRAETLANVMFQVKDRQDRELVLGPTHEEVITELLSKEVSSYKQLPRTFYQIQTKFRDEIRPRFGLMRAKEFIMKDAYSFDVSWEAADTSYQAMYDAYHRIFQRCGLDARAVEADTGAMGGNTSHEFMVLTDAGEDAIVECDNCQYAANTERAERSVTPTDTPSAGEMRTIDTPGQKSIEEVSKFLNRPEAQLIKTLVFNADGQAIAALVPGNRDVCEQKLNRIIGAKSLEPATDDFIADETAKPVGFLGPIDLGIPVYADISLQDSHDRVIGANQTDKYLEHVDFARDVDLSDFHDIALVTEGDACPRCDRGRLRQRRGVEVGHVFKLGTKYAEAFGADFLDENGKSCTMTMGCYGIGISRTLQSAIEQSHDENGIVWPAAIAPYQVDIVVLKPGDETSMAKASELATDLTAAGLDVLIDDRKERPGVKFKDAELLGFPVRVVIGERSLQNGQVEIRRRTDTESTFVDTAQALTTITEYLS